MDHHEAKEQAKDDSQATIQPHDRHHHWAEYPQKGQSFSAISSDNEHAAFSDWVPSGIQSQFRLPVVRQQFLHDDSQFGFRADCRFGNQRCILSCL